MLSFVALTVFSKAHGNVDIHNIEVIGGDFSGSLLDVTISENEDEIESIVFDQILVNGTLFPRSRNVLVRCSSLFL